MKIGVFDHMDRASVPLSQQYEARLALVALYDRAGFYMYHVAEHHSTPLGMAPSPGIFLAALSQRTSRLRFGPLVYPLALYHPLRLIEEIAMLDHLSNGRFEFGIGKGASHHELAIYGAEAGEHASAQFDEARDILMLGLSRDRIDYDGRFYTFRDVPVELAPMHGARRPIWYGVSTAESARRAARKRYSFVCNHPAARARLLTNAYREAWAAGEDAADALPLMGVGRFVVVADANDTARALAERAYPLWFESFWKLWDARGGRPSYLPLPETFAGLEAAGLGVAGDASHVLDYLARDAEQSGVNYIVCRFAFGDLTEAEASRSVALFSEAVLPSLGVQQPSFGIAA
jgi:alkanesulfonate monooxygenase SsuD/methylene tetrahydromethanopterin reductase-like flavin-dependent oxidoreductase (luciferase family)